MKRTVRNRSYMLFFNLKCVGTTASEFSRLPASFFVRGLCTIRSAAKRGACKGSAPFLMESRCGGKWQKWWSRFFLLVLRPRCWGQRPENYSFYFAANAYAELSPTKHL